MKLTRHRAGRQEQAAAGAEIAGMVGFFGLDRQHRIGAGEPGRVARAVVLVDQLENAGWLGARN